MLSDSNSSVWAWCGPAFSTKLMLVTSFWVCIKTVRVSCCLASSMRSGWLTTITCALLRSKGSEGQNDGSWSWEDVRAGGVVKEDRSYTHRSNNSACSPYFSWCSCRLSSSAGTGRLVFELQPDSFVKTWTECDLFIKRRSVPWHLQHPLKWRCITYFTRRVKSHPSLRLSPSWNVVQLAGC